jgi:hypothetical protein
MGCLLIGVPLNGCWDRASDSVGGAQCAGCRASSLQAARAANGGAESPC